MQEPPKDKEQQPESMENILKSIKTIISGDYDKEAMAKQQAAPNEDILDLTEKVVDQPAVTEAAPAAPAEMEAPAAVEVPKEQIKNLEKADEKFKKDVLADIDAALSAVETPAASAPTPAPAPLPEPAPAPVAAAPAPQPEPQPQPQPQPQAAGMTQNQKDSNLLSEQAAAAAKESLQSLMQSSSVGSNISSPSLGSGKSLEDIVVESLKPMMAEWLNTNLPVIVRQIVEKEVKKIVP